MRVSDGYAAASERRVVDESAAPEPATLCGENQHGAASSGYSTCGNSNINARRVLQGNVEERTE